MTLSFQWDTVYLISLKEKKKKSSQRKHETSIGSKREEGKVHSEKERINCTRKASVNTTG